MLLRQRLSGRLKANFAPDDNLFTKEPDDKAPPAKPNGDATGEPDRMALLETQVKETAASVSQTNEAVSGLTSTLNSLLQQSREYAATVDPEPEVEPDEMVTRLAADPKGVIRGVASEVVAEARALLEPQQRTIIDATHETILAGERTRVDTEFGPGTFDESFYPKMKPTLDFLRSEKGDYTRLADKNYVSAQVTLLKGHLMSDLVPKAEAFKKQQVDDKAAERLEIARGLPSPGIVTATGEGNALSQEASSFLDRVEKHTGETQDRELFTKLLTASEATPGASGTTLSEYIKITGDKK